VALIFADDGIELESTLRHHLDQGFETVVLLGAEGLSLAEDLAGRVHRVTRRYGLRKGVVEAVNTLARAAPGTWFYWGYSGEYLFFPYCESRAVGELLAFHMEERRPAMMTYVLDLYAADLAKAPGGVSRADACFDRVGYYALERWNDEGQKLEGQFNIFGGLRWRFEQHVSYEARRIDRIGLFRAKEGLELHEDFTFNDPEYNTISCPWHHNITAAVCSFRAAKALKTNPGSADQIRSFWWHGSERFDWSSRQLLERGFIEPGQWF